MESAGLHLPAATTHLPSPTGNTTMWIVQYALARRYTIGVLAILILLFGTLAARRMPTDILPEGGDSFGHLVWTTPACRARMSREDDSFSEAAILKTPSTT